MESCLVDIGDDLTDKPTLFKQSYVLANKVHHCCECGEPILDGQRYQKTIGVWDNEFSSFKTCIVCSNIQEVLVHDYIFGQLLSGLREFINDNEDGIPEDCMVDLKPVALARVCGLIESTW